MPDLKKLLDKMDNAQPERQSPDQLMAKVMMLNAAFGGTVSRDE